MHGMCSLRFKGNCLMVLIIVSCVIMRPSLSLSNTYSAGVYVTNQVGGYNWHISESSDYLFASRNPPPRFTPVMTGAGLVWAGEFLDGQFMLRQNLGFEAFMVHRLNLTRFSFVNTFAYVPFRTDAFLVWVGPQLNLFYIWGKDSTSSVFLYNDYMSINVPLYRRRTYGILPIGTGVALGLDYEIYRNLRLSFEGGFHFSTSAYGQSHEIGNGKASVTGYEGFVNLSFMYRFTEKVRHTQVDD
jgi:hypothetical protein